MMKRYKLLSIGVIVVTLIGTTSCKKQLDVKNPNSPTIDQAQTESGVISLAVGGVYTNGFNGISLSPLNGLGSSYFSMALYYHEELADNINSDIANQNINIFNVPDYIILSNGTKLVNSSPSKANARINNSRDKRPNNAFYYEWAYMYSLNNAMNQVLNIAQSVKFSGDAATRLNTITAWCYWWKAFAYAKIGSIYYAGIINNAINTTNGNYVTSAAMIAESNRYFELAKTTLTGITNTAEYTTVLNQLIPSFTLVGNGGVLTPAMWIDNINTMEARNLLANKLLSAMTPTDWNTILTLTTAGIKKNDFVFTGVTAAANGFLALSNGSTAAMTAGSNASSTFKISERLIQEYKPGDNRLLENYYQQQYLGQSIVSSTRWALANGGNSTKVTGSPAVPSPPGTNLPSYILADKTTPGNYQLWIAGSYEENELMKGEALINTGQVDLGLASVDNVRVYQGAGLPAVSGTGLSLALAKEELRRERRVALVFRGVSFYDARRQGYIYDISKGGGRTGCVVFNSDKTLNTNATINYNFLDYWDVPADEAVLNPPTAGSAPIVNPN